MKKRGKNVVKRDVKSAVGVVCFNKEDPNQVLLVKHGEDARQPKGIYGLPSGHVEPGEEPIKAAEREFREETGLDALDLTPLNYDFGLVEMKLKTGTFFYNWDVFICKRYKGELKGTSETEPEWVGGEIENLWLLPNIIKAVNLAREKIENEN